MAALPPEGARIRLFLNSGGIEDGTVEAHAPEGDAFAFESETLRHQRQVKLSEVWSWRPLSKADARRQAPDASKDEEGVNPA